MASASGGSLKPKGAAVGPSPVLRGSSPASEASLTDVPLSKRQSAQERFNDILETARERATTMSSRASVRSPPLGVQHLPSPGPYDDSADETTGIVTARSHPDYQSTQTSSTPRQRRPVRQSDTDHPPDQNGSPQVTENHWLKDYLQGLWSIELENKGSVARDHLALERTFLAWLRTSLAFASIGIAITQLFRLNTSIIDAQDDPRLHTVRHIGTPLGATFLGISILVLFLGYHRYYQSQQWVMKGKFPASRGTIILVSLVAFALMVVSLGVVIWIHPTGSE
ncbi:hypothetical protein F5B20DRAFT_453698 [Whalleya microplaca]|nr:hypothetical protein F5B20DRAFT_453698 [Whalleya microplaca]